MKTVLDAYPQVEFDSAERLAAWLEANHQELNGAWAITWKKGSGGPYFPYIDMVDELLRFGWIDGLRRKLDESRSQQLITPRRSGSVWSAVNKAKIERLHAADLLFPAGLAAVERAKADGSWFILDEVDRLVVPPDFQAALDGLPPAAEHFTNFPPSSRRLALYWIKEAKTAPTRARRIEEAARLAQQNKRVR